MIAKAVKGKGFRGALNYDLNSEKGQMLDTNMAGDNPRDLAREFGEIRKLRPNLGKAVLHVSLSAAIDDHLTDDQWRDIGKLYLKEMGLDNNQYLITRHTDTEHQHIHILANRIQFNGEVTSDSQDYKRQEVIMRKIEQDYGLTKVTSSRDADRRAPTKGEIEQSIRTATPSTRQQLQQLSDLAASQSKNYTEYAKNLEAIGVELIPVTQQNGQKLTGLSYRLDGVTMKGSDLGKKYSAAGLQKTGVTYDKDRDYETVRNSIEREAARKHDRTTGDITPEETQGRGGISGNDRTISQSNGELNTGKHDHTTNLAGTIAHSGRSGTSGEGESESRRSDEQGNRRHESSHRARKQSHTEKNNSALLFGVNDGLRSVSPYYRVLALSSTATTTKSKPEPEYREQSPIIESPAPIITKPEIEPEKPRQKEKALLSSVRDKLDDYLDEQAVEYHTQADPKLKETFAYLNALKQKLEKDGSSYEQMKAYIDTTKDGLAQMIDAGKYPTFQYQEAKQEQKTSQEQKQPQKPKKPKSKDWDLEM